MIYKLEKDIIPPFSVFDTKKHTWQERKAEWLALGYDGTETRKESQPNTLGAGHYTDGNDAGYTSCFDPVLTEQIYRWFCPDGGNVLDPFAGGVTRGMVASIYGLHYTGIDIRKEQIEANEAFFKGFIEGETNPLYLQGSAHEVLDSIGGEYDLLFTCPPYADLEDDLSNMEYGRFKQMYGLIIEKACRKVKYGGYAVVVIGEVRSKDGYYLGLIPETIKAFKEAGMEFYNEAILVNKFGSAPLRAATYLKKKKLVSVHQSVLVFRKDEKEFERVKKRIKKMAKNSDLSEEELMKRFLSM